MDLTVFRNIEYGLFMISTAFGGKDNGCIINTVTQLTSSDFPKIGFAINKNNFTCELLQKSKKFNISILNEKTPFDTFRQFGFQSGRNVNKFENLPDTKRTDNGILYLDKDANSVISGYVIQEIDLDSHIYFIATVVDTKSLSQVPSATYSFYHKNIKPKPQQEKKNGYRCVICGYVYEGEELPKDFICPICKHGVTDFEKI